MTLLELPTRPIVLPDPEIEILTGEESTRLVAPRRGLIARFLRGKVSDPAWVRPALLTLLTVTAVLYFWDLSSSGWANTFYSAAVQAGSTSWKAMFFGSSDSSNFITLDKIPGFLWPMEISARIFGLSSWSLLAPQALEGVATVGLVYLSVRRWFSAPAAILAASVVAMTPVAAMIFRYNSPDALLAMLLTAATYATIRALERAQTAWLVAAGTLIGLGFLTKMSQALLIVPVICFVYLFAAPTAGRRRVWQLAAMTAAVLVSAGWWLAAVALTPAADRPYVGGTHNDSILNLTLQYNGIGRIAGVQTVRVGGSGTVSSAMLGPTGISRLFTDDYGNMMSWLLPGAAILVVVLLALTAQARRTDRERAAVLLWGGSLAVTAAMISFAPGIVHPYYTIALVPPLGSVIGVTVAGLWSRRESIAARVGLCAGLAATVVWSEALLRRTPDWFPLLHPLVLVAGTLAIVLIAALPMSGRATKANLGLVVAVLGLGAAFAAPVLSTVATAASPQSGVITSVTPSPAGGLYADLSPGMHGVLSRCGLAGGAETTDTTPEDVHVTAAFCAEMRREVVRQALLAMDHIDPAVTRLLQIDAGHYSWVAAIVGSVGAAGYQLAAGQPVMAIGGYHASDPVPTLAQFERYVSQGRIHYFVVDDRFVAGNFTGPNQAGDIGRIMAWAESHSTHEIVHGVTLYDLASTSSS